MSTAFQYIVDRFADLQILRYQVAGFEALPFRTKRFLYHLSEAALMGRDIIYDQNCRYNLAVRRALEAIYLAYQGDRKEPEFVALETYLKRVWFSNGIHHHYSGDKFVPGFSEAFFRQCIGWVGECRLPLRRGQRVSEWLDEICPVLFDPAIMPKRTVQGGSGDLVRASSVNFYGTGVTQKEVEGFYEKLEQHYGKTNAVSFGLNSRLVKRPQGGLAEERWFLNGLYGEAIEQIIGQLYCCLDLAEHIEQQTAISHLIAYYATGNLRSFDKYSIQWVKDIHSEVDFVNGFIETYSDPLGRKATWESLVNLINHAATYRTETISRHAQWFEDHSPVDSRFKKQTVKGVTAKVITAVMLGGDCYPSTPIGINLPNADWIRRDYGSKSVTIENITEAYDKASEGSGFQEEFVWSETERQLLHAYGFITDNLHTDLHECLGHGSGQLLPDTHPNALKAYGATLEEARADLYALYYLADDILCELDLLPSPDAYKAEYYRYLMNGLMTQLTRIEPGKQLEEAHMRNRQLIARWVYEQGQEEKVVELRQREGKTYVVINDYRRLRDYFGRLLAEVQRIKSEGDYEAGKALVERYGVQVDPVLHAEVLERYRKLDLAPYKGFVNPVLRPVRNASGRLVDISIDYSESYVCQMLRYSREYSYLPTYND